MVGRGSVKAVISHAADLEVHKGTDGRYYALDTARVLPPRFPFGGEGGTQRTLTEVRIDESRLSTSIHSCHPFLSHLLCDSLRSS